ncbi:MAG TPA: exodeoxyribonuclease V subunit alpha [Planctomycetota bacterium]|nr:exodeoxyribonuclease V subunit alpha [Planctomycetota bacterium]
MTRAGIVPPPPPEPTPALAARLGQALWQLASGGDRDLLLATVLLLCQERDQGHVCVALADWQGQSLDGNAPFPPVAEWASALAATGLCGGGSADAPLTPLVLDGRRRLYLLRHFRTEQRLLAFVRQRLQAPPLSAAAVLRGTLAALHLLPDAAPGEPDWQLAAIAAAVHRSFAIVCGGPGTGKTTTVARLLAVLQHGSAPLRVALAAPTGKAAARLGEALQQHAAAHPELAATMAAVEPKTLHRLLGYLPLDDAFRAGPDRLLPYDLVVVDEASMVDPAVLAVLFSALRPETRLVLVGDKDQLAAVAAGQVLGDLCRTARPELGVDAELAAFVAAATRMQLPVQAGAAPIAGATVALRTNHRFAQQPGIGAFARALAARDHAAARQVLAAAHEDLVLAADAEQALAAIADAIAFAAGAADPAQALQRLGRVRILTATRHGPNGASTWNRRVEALLRARGLGGDGPWYDGRPVLVLANDPQNQIYNGDLGVVRRAADGREVVWFAGRDGAPRPLAPLRLPPHETAWAMTVHKAQGSEFDEVLLVLPDRPGPLWQASLVYTGVTRARRRATLLADPAMLDECLARWPERSSGLADGLRD